MTSLDEYDRLEPWNNASVLGEKLMGVLADHVKTGKGKLVSIAGKGLLISLKFSSPETAGSFCAKASQNGLLVDTGKVDTSTILIRPSLLVTAAELKEIVDKISKALSAIT